LMYVELLKDPREALVIPEESLLPLGEQQFVFIVSADNTVEKRELRIGGRRPGLVEVVEGLADGDQVVTHGHMQITPGQPVTVTAVDDGSLTLPALLRSLPGGGQPE